jgi:hypothetical protein
MQKDENEEALRLLDGAIALAMNEKENQWVLTLCHHAAVISNSLGSWSQVKHYYEKSLSLQLYAQGEYDRSALTNLNTWFPKSANLATSARSRTEEEIEARRQSSRFKSFTAHHFLENRNWKGENSKVIRRR